MEWDFTPLVFPPAACSPNPGLVLAATDSAQSGDWGHVQTLLEPALLACPDDPDFLCILGIARLCLRDHEAAVRILGRAARIAPSRSDILTNLGAAQLAARCLQDAFQSLRRALLLDFKSPATWTWLGHAQQQQGDPVGAAAAFRWAQQLLPASADLLLKLGDLCQGFDELPSALRFYSAALEVSPALSAALSHRAEARLASGDWNGAGEDLRHLHLDTGLPAVRTSAQPQWDGQPSGHGTLLVELNDDPVSLVLSIHVIPRLHALGLHVVVDGPASLRRFLGCLDGVSHVSASPEPLPPHDCRVSVLDAARVLGMHSWRDLPAGGCPSLHVPPAQERRRQIRDSAGSGLAVGLVSDSHRMPPPALLRDVVRVPGVCWFALPPDTRSLGAASQPCLPGFVNLGCRCTDLLDLAQWMDGLDLVIAGDTLTAWIAHAMGKACWLLLQKGAGFPPEASLPGQAHSPATRIFRQRRAGEWSSVPGELVWELNAAVAARREPSRRWSPSELFQTALNAQRSGFPSAAISRYRACLACSPSEISFRLNLGLALKENGELPAAETVLRDGLEVFPSHPILLNALGTILQAEDRLPEAAILHHQALGLEPTLLDAKLNLGVVLRELGDVQSSVQVLQNATREHPDSPQAHWNLGFGLFLSGQWASAWPELEWRTRDPSLHHVHRVSSSATVWQGQALNGQRLLVRCEQGAGDMLQFCRYAAFAKQQGATVLLESEPALQPILASLPWVDAWVQRGRTPLPPHDFVVPLMSLPWLHKTTPANVPLAHGYLQAPGNTPIPPLNEKVANRPRVGLVWGGNTGFANDRRRSPGLRTLAPLLAVEGIHWFALQAGPRVRELLTVPGAATVVDLSPWLADYGATADAIQQLDLVVTSDTSVAHLAGAIGKPVWLLLSHAPDWRWMATGSTTPWYGSMQVLRQPEPGNWTQVVDHVARLLVRVSESSSEVSVNEAVKFSDFPPI